MPGKHVYCEKPMVHIVDEGHETSLKPGRNLEKIFMVGSQGMIFPGQ